MKIITPSAIDTATDGLVSRSLFNRIAYGGGRKTSLSLKRLELLLARLDASIIESKDRFLAIKDGEPHAYKFPTVFNYRELARSVFHEDDYKSVARLFLADKIEPPEGGYDIYFVDLSDMIQDLWIETGRITSGINSAISKKKADDLLCERKIKSIKTKINTNGK